MLKCDCTKCRYNLSTVPPPSDRQIKRRFFFDDDATKSRVGPHGHVGIGRHRHDLARKAARKSCPATGGIKARAYRSTDMRLIEEYMTNGKWWERWNPGPNDDGDILIDALAKAKRESK